MNKMKKLAVAVFAVAALAGCASTKVTELARADRPVVSEPQQAKVSRPTQSYGTMGGYRYRRFVASAASPS